MLSAHDNILTKRILYALGLACVWLLIMARVI